MNRWAGAYPTYRNGMDEVVLRGTALGGGGQCRWFRAVIKMQLRGGYLYSTALKHM